jgi:hypothetical protein
MKMKISTIQNPSKELGFVSSACVQIDAKKGKSVDYSSGLWPFEQEVQQIGTKSVTLRYEEFVGDILSLIESTSVSKIITVGMEAMLNDLISIKVADKMKIMIPNTSDVDVERIKLNYEGYNSVIVNPYQALEYVGANTLVVVPIFRLNDNSLYMYNYARRFMGSDVAHYSFCCLALELLPAIQSLDYRTAPYSPELRELSNIEGIYFRKTLTF